MNGLPTPSAAPLLIGNLQIRRDAAGRYCLNDLHQAAGNDARSKPANWLRLQQTAALIAILDDASSCLGDQTSATGKPASGTIRPLLTSEQRSDCSPIQVIQGGLSQGTYAAKSLVYAYAMWISPRFHLTVIDAYDRLITGRYQPAPGPVGSAALHSARAQLISRLYRADRPGEIEALHAQAVKLSLDLDLPPPQRPAAPIARTTEVQQAFWRVVDLGLATGQVRNHARRQDLIAINLPEARCAAQVQGTPLPASTGLTWGLSSSPRLIHRNRCVNSPVAARPTRCWVFSR